MSFDYFFKEDSWKVLGLVLPVLTAIWGAIKQIFIFIRNGKITRLKNYYKEHGEHLDDEDKTFISKSLKKKIMRQIIGIGDNALREKILYILNRCDLRIPQYSINNIARFLKYDGKRFYFERNRMFTWKRNMARFASALYSIYALLPGIIYFKTDGADMTWWAALLLFFVFVFIAMFLVSSYPSNKKMQGVNGEMLKIDSMKFERKRK